MLSPAAVTGPFSRISRAIWARVPRSDPAWIPAWADTLGAWAGMLGAWAGTAEPAPGAVPGSARTCPMLFTTSLWRKYFQVSNPAPRLVENRASPARGLSGRPGSAASKSASICRPGLVRYGQSRHPCQPAAAQGIMPTPCTTRAVTGPRARPDGTAARLLPLSVDGLILAASLVVHEARNGRRCASAGPAGAVVRHQRDGRREHRLWAGFGLLGALILAWPAVAFIGAVEMVMQLVGRTRGPVGLGGSAAAPAGHGWVVRPCPAAR